MRCPAPSSDIRPGQRRPDRKGGRVALRTRYLNLCGRSRSTTESAADVTFGRSREDFRPLAARLAGCDRFDTGETRWSVPKRGVGRVRPNRLDLDPASQDGDAAFGQIYTTCWCAAIRVSRRLIVGRRWSGVASDSDVVTVLLGGDVMLGRGVDQILPHPGAPELREPYMRDARGYVRLAEHANGPIPRPADWRWPWGEVLALLDEAAPDVRLINLETTITADGEFADRKPVCYRMHPDNLPTLTAFRPDVCALANNHILDFGYQGLTDTIAALTQAGIQGAGAGADLTAARRPAVVTVHDEHRVLIGSVAMASAGVPESWAAREHRPGVWLIRDPSQRDAADDVAAQVLAHKRDSDVAIVSVHWGSNWGYAIAPNEIAFAHRLIDAGIDIVHGHSSHHPRPDRDLPRQTHPVRVRRCHRRLRGHRRARIVPQRPPTPVFGLHRSRQRGTDLAADDSAAGAADAPGAGLPHRRRMATQDHRAHQPPVQDSCRGSTKRSTGGRFPAQRHPSPDDSSRCGRLTPHRRSSGRC